MTAAQQAALETLAGRVLTALEITTIDPWLDSDNRRDDLIAGLLSIERRKISSTMVSSRGLAEKLEGGPVAAEIVLGKLEKFVSDSEVMLDTAENSTAKMYGKILKRQLSFLNSEGLDFGSAALRGMLDGFASLTIITVDEATKLKAIASTRDPLSQDTVSRALNIAEGRMVL